MQRGAEFGIPTPPGEIEAEFVFENALDTLNDPRTSSVGLENSLIEISRLNLSPIQSERLLDVASRSAYKWFDTIQAPEPIVSVVFPHLMIPSSEAQATTCPLPATTQIMGEMLAGDPNLYEGWRAGVLRGVYGRPVEVLTGLLSKITSQEYLEQHDFDPIADDYVDLVKTVLGDAKVKSQGNDEFVKEAQAAMSTEVLGAIALSEMQKPIPQREQLTAQAIVAMVTIEPESFTEGVEKRVLHGDYGDTEEILSGIIRSVSAKIERKGYDGPNSPDSLTMAIVFDDLLTTSTERARELMPEVIESPWYWDREHSFSYDALQALGVTGVPVGEEEEFVREYARAIEGNFDPRLDQKELAQISAEGTFAQRFAHVIRTIRQNEGFFRQITLDINPFEDGEEYPYIPDNVLVAAIRNPEGFAQLPALETVAPEIMKRLKDPAPFEERNSGIIRDMLATEKPLETALKIQAKLEKRKARK